MDDVAMNRFTAALLAALAATVPFSAVFAAEKTAAKPSPSPAKPAAPAQAPAAPQPLQQVFIREYRVEGGGHLLPQIEVESAVYPYLGPARTVEDVEAARAALEKAYREKGFQAVSVQIPPQDAKGGIVILQVLQGTVARLRVRDARYFSPSNIKRDAPSLAEGKAVNFNDVTRDIVNLNQLADRRVTPTLSAGREPGTVDIDLTVKDTLPLHSSVELNNRYSANTVPLRVNGSVSYSNLWQLGHTVGGSFQLAPERLKDAEIFSAYYLAHIPSVNGLSLMLQGTKQNSNVASLGGANSIGKGEVVGARAIMNLPAGKAFYHSFSFGVDYKRYDQGLEIAGVSTLVPVTYYPLSFAYNAGWTGPGYSTSLNTSLNLHIRGTGVGPSVSGTTLLNGTNNPTAFGQSRFAADDNYIYIRGDLSHTHDLPAGAQVYGKIQGQISDQPLLNNEQFSGGGLDSARGYLESEVLGDNALFASFELRSPSLGGWSGKRIDEWRVYAFSDMGILTVRKPLQGQTSRFNLASYGVGSRIRIEEHFSASLDVGIPLISQGATDAHDLLFTFRVSAEF